MVRVQKSTTEVIPAQGVIAQCFDSQVSTAPSLNRSSGWFTRATAAYNAPRHVEVHGRVAGLTLASGTGESTTVTPCEDLPADDEGDKVWHDHLPAATSERRTCKDYELDQLCTPSGTSGHGFLKSGSSHVGFYNLGDESRRAAAACCACGGGALAKGSGYRRSSTVSAAPLHAYGGPPLSCESKLTLL